MSRFDFGFGLGLVYGMLVAVAEGLSLAGVLPVVVQRVVLQADRSPWLVLEFQVQLEPREVAGVVCWGVACSSRCWVTAGSRVARYPAEDCSLVVSGLLEAVANLLESTR